jgi:4-amino-4-deoxy-L-arabinose transferase-like glycosyltransferase
MPASWRDRFLRALVLLGAATFLITELLSLFHALRFPGLLICWGIVAVAAVIFCRKLASIPRFRLDPLVLFCAGACAVILTLTAVTAGFSPPNSADAMAYHMPRVVYWTERAGVSFFPTSYFNQIMLQPFAEYLMLHTYVLTGGDHFINFVQWFASVASVIGVSCVAGMLGAGTRGQAIAALFCATIPSGILASTGAKNDYVLAMWLVAAAYFALRFVSETRTVDAVFLGLAIGLALLTKATAYLYAPWIVAGIFLTGKEWLSRRSLRALAIAAVCALAVNLPHYSRNIALSGSPLGFDSAQGNGYFRWRNETFGWKQTTSNLLRNLSEQLGARDERWNQGVYRVVAGLHQRLGIALDDPDTTWRGAAFAPPVNANHEANAPNRWQLAILSLLACLAFYRAIRGADKQSAGYALALLMAFVAFCAYLKWQPFQGRLFLPLFVLGAPLAGALEGIPAAAGAAQFVFCLLLIANARPAVLQNWVRPLKGPDSILRTPRNDRYFADMSQWHNAETYKTTVARLLESDCQTIGIDITNLQLEYPIQALVRQARPGVQFLHTGVDNVSTRYPPPANRPACAVVCLDCAGDTTRLQLYSDFPVSVPVERFVLLFRGR